MNITKLIRYRKNKFMNKFISILLKRQCVDIPSSVIIGKNVTFPHNSFGLVIHPNTIIKDNVKIYQGVTIGRADIHIPFEDSNFKSVIIDENAIICAGAKILCKSGTLYVGKNTIIAANAVLLESTGDNEVWGGIPAKKIRERK